MVLDIGISWVPGIGMIWNYESSCLSFSQLEGFYIFLVGSAAFCNSRISLPASPQPIWSFSPYHQCWLRSSQEHSQKPHQSKKKPPFDPLKLLQCSLNPNPNPNSLGARGSGSKHPLGLPPPANTDFQNSPLQGCTLHLRLLVAFFLLEKMF